MAMIETLKGKNALITGASIAGALVVEQLLERRGKPMPNLVDKLPGNAGDLIDDLGRGVTSVAKRASSAIGNGDDDQSAEEHDDSSSRGLEELAERRQERQERRERRRNQS